MDMKWHTYRMYVVQQKKGKTMISFAVICYGYRIAPLMKPIPLLANTSSLSTLLIVYSS